MIELPYILLQTLVYGVIVYAMIGFDWSAKKFFLYLFFMYFTFLYFTFYGMMTVAVTPNHNVAAIVASAFYGIWNLFSGFIVPRPVSLFLRWLSGGMIVSAALTQLVHLLIDLNKQRMPVWWRWYFWACPVAWTLYGLVASQFGDFENDLEGTDQTVKEFLRSYFGYRTDFVGAAAAVIVGIAVSFGFIFAFSIKFFNFQKR